jgi:hypothetical protein
MEGAYHRIMAIRTYSVRWNNIYGIMKQSMTVIHGLPISQTGLVGYWAEWHTLGNSFIPDETREKILNWYGQAFHKTPVMVMTRYPSIWAKNNKLG